MIDGTTRVLGIVGWPLGHTLSPALHNFICARLGAPYRYLPFPVPDPRRLGDAIRGLAAAGVAGVNVTIPYKVAAVSYCDELSSDARAAGAVNTLRLVEGRVLGHDTDVSGFGRPIIERPIIIVERRALILGAGGAARAAAVFLGRAGAAIRIAGRTRARAEALVEQVREQCRGAPPEALDWEDRNAAVREADVIVNATPIGMWPRVNESPLDLGAPLGPGHLVYDVVYNPVRTRLIERAERAGACVVDGLEMLIHQGLDALEGWIGRRIDRDLAADARRALEAELKRSAAASGARR